MVEEVQARYKREWWRKYGQGIKENGGGSIGKV